jgi:ATP-dependent RNA helicase DDX24/MAK5
MGASASPPKLKSRRPLRALVLAPTRELALQVSQHLNACLSYHDTAAISSETPKKGKRKATHEGNEKGSSMPRAPPPVSVAAIVGGMSAHKQGRILERGVDVLVATPGRLWDILEGVRQTESYGRKLKRPEQDDALAENVKNLRFLVLDEADRMVETGHFAELDNILRLTQRQLQCVLYLPFV